MDINKAKYLNENTVRKSRRNGIIMLAIGGPVFILFLITYVQIMIEVFGKTAINFNEIMGALTFIMIVILILAPFFLLARGGLRRIILTSRAVKFNALFEADDDGLVPADEIAQKLKMRKESIADQIGEMLKRKYLKNVRIMEADPPLVLLTDGVIEKWHDAYYLNERVLFDEKVNAVLGTAVLGMFVVSIMVYLPIFVLIALEDRFPLFGLLIWMIMFALLFWGFFAINKKRKVLKRASAYNQVLEGCEQSEMQVSDLAQKAKVREDTALKDIKFLLQNDILKGCSLDLSHKPSVVLADVRLGSAVFAAVNCPHCGSTSKIRSGRAAKCPYCGNFITAPEDKPAVLKALNRNSAMRAYQRALPQSGQYEFLNEDRRKKVQERAQLYTIAGGFILMMVVTIIGILLSFGISEGIGPLIWTAVFILVGGFVGWKLFYEGLMQLRARKYAMTAAKLFAITPYRELGTEDITAITGLKGTDLLKRIFRHGFMKNCSLTDGKVILKDKAHADSAYVRNDCPHCGAEMMIKKGVVKVCSWCGSYVDEKGVMHIVNTRNKKVTLNDTGENKGAVIAYVNDLTGLSGVQMEELVHSLPAEIALTDESGADAIRESLEGLGASVSVS